MTREEFVRRMHSRLDKWNNDIDALLARREEIDQSLRAELGLKVEDLRKRRDEAKQQLEAVEKASESAWQDMKAGLELAWEAVSEAIESARSRYNK